jgi:hypothetical protein
MPKLGQPWQKHPLDELERRRFDVVRPAAQSWSEEGPEADSNEGSSVCNTSSVLPAVPMSKK